MIIPIALFYIFSGLTIFSAVMVISYKNPVHSVLFLILAFFNAAGLFVLLGAELIAMLLVIVYVGAVAVLFLFVVMMLNINFAKMKEGFMKYLPLGIIVAVILLAELYVIVSHSQPGFNVVLNDVFVQQPAPDSITNTEAIGNVLYTDYIYLFQLAGMILLVAMIGAITLTHRKREGVRKQVISDQLKRSKKDTVKVVKVKTKAGVK